MHVSKSNFPGVEYRDLRANAQHIYLGQPYTPITRLEQQITAICLHQTACLLGERDERMYAVGAHAVATRGGQIKHLNDGSLRIIAANGWDFGAISLEMDGVYAGIKGDIRTVWDDPTTPQREQPMTPTRQLIEASRVMVDYWIRIHPNIKFIVAHRQSSGDREADPGQELWQAVGMWAKARYGLRSGDYKGYCIGTGKAIPVAWDEAEGFGPY